MFKTSKKNYVIPWIRVLQKLSHSASKEISCLLLSLQYSQQPEMSHLILE